MREPVKMVLQGSRVRLEWHSLFWLPETDHEAAHNVLAKLRISLLEEMDKNKWSITFSFGVLTCTNSTQNTEELVKTADDLMYSAKRGGKNAIKYASYPSD